MVLWWSPDTPFLSCFLVSARLRVCSSRALSRLRSLFHVGAWCLDPGTLFLFRLSSGFVSGFGHSRSRLVLLRERAVSSSLGPCAPLSVCVVFCCTQLVLQLRAFSHFVFFCVARSLCFFTGCVLSCLSCFVWTRGLWVFSLAACSCPVLHMASDFVLLAMCLCFCFVWAHGLSCLVLCAMCSHKCIIHSFMSIVLTPPTLFPDHWLICPTCVFSLPSSFAPFIISLCLQSRASSSSMFPWLSPALPCLALPCLALPCLALPCLALPCLALPCLALPALPCQSVFPYGVVFVCWFYFMINKALFFLLQVSPRSIPSPIPDSWCLHVLRFNFHCPHKLGCSAHLSRFNVKTLLYAWTCFSISIDFILGKSWWFEKAKLIKHGYDQLTVCRWPLGRYFNKEKTYLTNKKNAPNVFLN